MSERTRWVYEGREQSYVKHEVLKRYLERFAIIVGKFSQAVTYVDCFSGPWKSRDERNCQDTSFGLAIASLRRAREAVQKTWNKSISLRCFFVEESAKAYKKLRSFADRISDATVETAHGTFEEHIPRILDFVARGGRGAFPFFFIDPKGWTGFALDRIRPLLQHRPSEVLINFMTSHIRRFVVAPEEQRREEFAALFGSGDVRDEVAGVADLRDREDLLLSRYMKAVRLAGGFNYACASTVLHPVKEDTHFHLIYATRSDKGVEVFKDADRKAMQLMETARAVAQQRARIEGSRNLELFSAPQVKKTTGHYAFLRDRYTRIAEGLVEQRLRTERRIPYDKAWEIAMRLPLVWDNDLKEWIDRWKKANALNIEGLKGKARVPQRASGHVLVWNL